MFPNTKNIRVLCVYSSSRCTLFKHYTQITQTAIGILTGIWAIRVICGKKCKYNLWIKIRLIRCECGLSSKSLFYTY